MDNPAKKGVKSEADIAEEARRKKEILDKVAQSNLPTKTILKELGISRSTYYSWLKRYEEEGVDGLIDSRSLARQEEAEEKATPAPEEVEAEAAEPLREAESAREEVSELPAVGQTLPEGKETVAEAQRPEKTDVKEAMMAEEKMGSGGGGKRGIGVYALIAIALLVIGLLLTISSSNYNSYHLRKSGEKLSLWKGKFAPRGSEMVDSFEPLNVGESDISSLTGKRFVGKDAVYKAVFTHFMDRINAQESKDNPDMAEINRLLAKAEEVIVTAVGEGRNMSKPRFELAKKRVAVAEQQLRNAYEKALPVYQQARKQGVADRTELESKMQEMKAALGVVPAKAEEEKAAEGEAPAPQPERKPVPQPAKPQAEKPGTS
ncbi:MAG: helix-turn-helix domain-containing protein [Syntrophobacteria bacterium]